MGWLKLSTIALGLSAWSLSASAVEVWTLKELTEAQKSAFTAFMEANGGEKALETVVGYSIDRTSQKTAAKARITYEVDGKLKVLNLFCHEHEENEIDCH